MERFGLRKNPTFESLLDRGATYELDENIHIYNRAALNFRAGFFSQPPPDEEVVDEGHDDRHEKALAQMRAAAAEIQTAADRHRAQAAETFRQGMPHAPQTAHEAAAAPAAPPPAAAAPAAPPRMPNMLDEPQTWRDRMQQRQETYKLDPHLASRQWSNRFRQAARQKAERATDLNNRRRRVPSPPPDPRNYTSRLQGKYDERLLGSMRGRNPQVKRPRTAPGPNERLAQARGL